MKDDFKLIELENIKEYIRINQERHRHAISQAKHWVEIAKEVERNLERAEQWLREIKGE